MRQVQYTVREDRDVRTWAGRWLEQRFPVDLPADHTAWLWVTFYAPENAAPGLYTGDLTLRDADGNSVALPVRMRVLDFTLQRPEGHWGMYVPGHFWGEDDGTCRNYAEAEYWNADNMGAYFRFWRTRGLNSPTLFHVYPDLKCVDGHTVADYPQVRGFAEGMKQAGISGDLCVDMRFVAWWANSAAGTLAALRKQGKSTDGDIGVYAGQGHAVMKPSPEAKRLFKEAIEQLLAIAEAENWPYVRLMADEEVANTDQKAATYDQFMPVILEVAPERAFLVDNAIGYGRAGIIDRGARDNLAVRQYNNWTQEGLDIARAQGKQVRSYNYGWRRSAWGLYQQSIGSTGYHQWADNWDYNHQWVQIRITEDGVVSSPRMERAREGRDDHAYCYTLQRLAERLDAKNRPEAAERAREALNEVVADLAVNRFPFAEWQSDTPTSELDRRRWRLVLAIQDARRNLGEPAVAFENTTGGRPSLRGVAARNIGQEPTEKSLQVIRVPEPIQMDGKMDEACWRTARNSTGALWWTWTKEAAMRAQAGSVEAFKKMYPPSHGRAQFAYDADALYIMGAGNHATEKSARCTHGDDDGGLWEDDCMEFFFATDPGSTGFYQLIVNVRGKRTLLNFGKVVKDSGITTATVSPINDSGGYSQEITVPWKALGLNEAPTPGTAWKANVGREFHSWNQITCWGQVNSQFAEKRHWGTVVFAGTDSVARIDSLQLGSRYPGRNRLTGKLTVDEAVEAATVRLRVLDENGAEQSQTVIKRDKAADSPAVSLDYGVPVTNQPAEWSLVIEGPDATVLGTIPVPIPPSGAAVSIDRCPASIVSGSVFAAELVVRLGDLTAPECRLEGEFVSPAGKRVSLPGVQLAAGRDQRVWVDSTGLSPGRWTMRLRVPGIGTGAPASTEIEVLPSPVAKG